MTAPGSTAATLIPFGTPSRTRRKLFCLPFAGGGPATYRTWGDLLPDDVQVLAVALPGRQPGRREPVPDTVAGLVDAVVPAIRDAADVPYAIFGHSLGALVAYEVTLALEAEAAEPAATSAVPGTTMLFVSGRRPPDESHTSRPVADLDDESFLDAIDARYGGVPAAVRQEPDLLALVLPALRADIRAYEQYVAVPGRRVGCPVHVYGGAQDTHPSPSALPGWQRCVVGDIAVTTFPGDHFYLAQAAAALTADIASRWASVASSAGGT